MQANTIGFLWEHFIQDLLHQQGRLQLTLQDSELLLSVYTCFDVTK